MDGTRHGVSRDESPASQGVIDKLRQAMVEFDSTFWRSEKAKVAARVLTLVRELLSEVDGAAEDEHAAFHVRSGLPTPSVLCARCAPSSTVVPGVGLVAEPLGSPHPGVTGHMPDDET